MPTPYMTTTPVPAERPVEKRGFKPGIGALWSEKRCGVVGLLRSFNARRGAGALLVALGLAASAPVAGRAAGQNGALPGVEAPPPVGGFVVAVVEPPAPAACIEAFNTVCGWVRDWAVPDDAPQADPQGTAGVCVTLRLAGATGRTLSRSVVMTNHANRGATLALATRAALREAQPKLALEKDATRAARLKEVAARVLVDVQFAGAGVPMGGDSADEIAQRLNPGRDGVMARVRAAGAGASDADDAVGAVFPGSMLSMSLTPGKALEVAVGRLNLPPVGLGEQRAKHGLEVYRFASRQVVQTEAGGLPEILFRGGRVVSMQEMNSQGLRDFASAMADHLCTHMWRGGGAREAGLGLRGSYSPLTDTYSPPVASPREQAVAALALARFARSVGTDAESRERAAGIARETLDLLTVRSEREADPLASPTDAGAWLMADAEVNQLPPVDDAGWAQRVGAFRVEAQKSLASAANFRDAEIEWDGAVSPGERAMVACAMAWTATDDAARARAGAAVRSLFRGTPAGELVALLPWLGWAELALVPDANTPVPAGEALRQLRALCWSRQRSAEVSVEDPDMAGGIVFSSGSGVWPTWQTLRPLAFLGTMLGDRRLTSDEELRREVLSLVASLRFARQLAVDGAVAHMIRDPSRALGGVRLAAWDQLVSLDATSLALLAVCESLRSADARTE